MFDAFGRNVRKFHFPIYHKIWILSGPTKSTKWKPTEVKCFFGTAKNGHGIGCKKNCFEHFFICQTDKKHEIVINFSFSIWWKKSNLIFDKFHAIRHAEWHWTWLYAICRFQVKRSPTPPHAHSQPASGIRLTRFSLILAQCTNLYTNTQNYKLFRACLS